MHPLRGNQPRLKRTLLNFFAEVCEAGLNSGKRCFAGDLGRRERAQMTFCREIPGFEFDARVWRTRFSAADSAGVVGRKILKSLNKGGKQKNWGGKGPKGGTRRTIGA